MEGLMEMLPKMARLLSGGTIVLAALLGLSGQVAYAPEAFAKGEMQNTSTAIVYEETIDGKVYQVSKLLINASPDQIWPFLIDYKNAATNFPTVKKCQVIEDKGNLKKIAYTVQPTGYPLTTFDYILEVNNRPKSYVEWHRLGGDFKEVKGFWKLEPQANGRSTLVTYGTYLVGDFFTPQFLIKKSVKQDLPLAMNALKKHAERNTEVAGRPGAGGRNE